MKKIIYTFFLIFNVYSATAQHINFVPHPSPEDTLSPFIPFSNYKNGNNLLVDVDHDGDLDVLITSSIINDSRFSIFFNDGQGNFSLHQTFNLSGNHFLLKKADLNQDGNIDVVIASPSEEILKVYYSDHTGNFTLAMDYANNLIIAENFDIADINNDHYPDLVSSISSPNSQRIVYLNNRHGLFYTSYTPLNIDAQTKIIDYNHDSIPDFYNYRIVYINDGHFGFNQVQLSNSYGQGGYNLLENLDNDTHYEKILSISNYQHNFIKFFDWDTSYNGNFIEVLSFEVPYKVNAIKTSSIVFDVDNDGDKDILITSRPENSYLFYNNGNFSYSPVLFRDLPKDNDFSPQISYGDINGDDYDDVLISTSSKTILYINQGGILQRAGNYFLPAASDASMAFADIDNDTRKELFVLGDAQSHTPVGNIYHFSNGNLSPIPYQRVPFASIMSYKNNIQLKDVDNDHDLDLCITTFREIDTYNKNNFFYVFLNDGNGGYTPLDSIKFKMSIHGTVKISDLDGNHYPDFIKIDNQHPIVYYNLGNNQYNLDTLYNVPVSAHFEILDLNNDGLPDILSDYSTFLNTGHGFVSTNQQFIQVDSIRDIFIPININSDTLQDLLFIEPNDIQSWLYVNNGDGTFHIDSMNLSAHNISYNDICYKYHPNRREAIYKHSYFTIDIDSDGDDDIFSYSMINDSTFTKNIFLNINGTLYKYNDNDFNQRIITTEKYDNFFVLDYNDDGLIDILAPENHDNKLQILINNGITNQPLLLERGSVDLCFNQNAEQIIDTINFNTIKTNYFDDFISYPIQFFNYESDALTNQNPLPQFLPVQVYANSSQTFFARVETSPPTILKFDINFKIKPQVGFFVQSICDVHLDGIEKIYPYEYLDTISYRFEFYSDSLDAVNNINVLPDSLVIHSGINNYWAKITDLQTYCIDIKKVKFDLIDCSNFQYNVQRIPYSPYHLDAPISPYVADDEFSNKINLGFKFNFFGDTHKNLAVGSNGVITFDHTLYGNYCPWHITDTVPSPHLPLNSIFGVYQDMDNSVNPGTYAYTIIGKKPFRKFVAIYDSIPLYYCWSDPPVSSQVILYETYNFIDVQVIRRSFCSHWNNGFGVLGIQNQDGTLGICPLNRNVGQWTASHEAWRFTPLTTFPDFQYIRCDTNNDGHERFNIQVIVNHFTAPGRTVTVHLSEEDARTAQNPLSGHYINVSNAQTLYVRIGNGTNFDIKRAIIAAIDCQADYDIDGVDTMTEDIDGDGNFGNDDTDNDGIPDFMDDDDDGDMVLTRYELVITRPASNINFSDTDSDGIPNYLDDDDDGDGTLTIDEDYNGNGDPTDDDINANGIPDYLDANVTNVSTLPSELYSIYPNPTQNNITISFKIPMKEINIYIYSSEGKLLQHLHSTNTESYLIQLPPIRGIYFIVLETTRGTARKIILKE